MRKKKHPKNSLKNSQTPNPYPLHTMNKRALSNAKEIYTRGGAVAASDWTNGSGRYITKRTIPPFCIEVCVFPDSDGEELYQDLDRHHWHFPVLPVYAKKAAKKLIKERPKVEKIVLMVDRRGLRKALKAKEEAA